MAERVRFELTVARATTVFKTAPINRSGTSPRWGPEHVDASDSSFGNARDVVLYRNSANCARTEFGIGGVLDDGVSVC